MSLYVQRNEEVISADSRSLISKRYCTVTSAMNREFWNITSDRQNSIYVGSYGRGTAIDTSDIDILMSLPESYYNQFNSVYGNGQSRLLQAVRQAILVRYPRSEVRAAYSARTAHPFQRNGAPFRFKLSKAQQVD